MALLAMTPMLRVRDAAFSTRLLGDHGMREFAIHDRDGDLLQFGQPLQEGG